MSFAKRGNFEVKGLADLEKNMLQFSDRVVKNVLGGMVRAGAVVVRDEARLNVPVSDKPHILKSYRSRMFSSYKPDQYGTWVLPGNLKKSIRVTRVKKSKTPHSVEYQVKASGKLSYYWLFIEFGTSKMPARSFLRKAFDHKKILAVERMRDYGVVRIEKEAAKRG